MAGIGGGKAIRDLTPEAMEQFNIDFPNVLGVKYFSVSSAFEPRHKHFL